MFKDDEEYSRKHPLNDLIKDTDTFLHGTSLKRYELIKSAGFLLRDIPNRNYSLSTKAICFAKYVSSGKLSNAKTIDKAMKEKYCLNPCIEDACLEGVVLEISGKALKSIDCHIFADWNEHVPRTFNQSSGMPNGVNYNCPILSVIVVDKDIPVRHLVVKRRFPYQSSDLARI
jgi:hypothetical protein